MNRKEEIWKDVPSYEGYYQASNFGRVRSLDRTVIDSRGRERFYKGRVIKGDINRDGYRRTTLRGDGIGRTFNFSQLVAMTFLGHKPNGITMVVDHINGDVANDSLDNLMVVTNRANTSTCFRSNRSSFSSGYVGVSWCEKVSKWGAHIRYKETQSSLGYYDSEIKASNAYQSALSKIEGGSFDPNYYKPKFSSEYKGVNFHKASNKWQARITINGKQKYLGLFPTEFLALQAYLKAEKENNISMP